MRVLVFGDSITQGFWAVERGWVDLVRKHYDELQVQDLEGRDDPTIFNVSISGDTSEDILRRIKNEVAARTWSDDPILPVVVLQIGLNDSSMRPSLQTKLEDYKQNLKKIYEIVSPLSSRVVFLGFSSCNESKTSPVYWGEYYWSNEKIKEYESAMAEVSQELNIQFIPIFDEFKPRVDAGDDLLPDGLHPNDAGHELIYQIVMPRLQELLK